MTQSEPDWLRNFLNIYWLRPENAVWRANNCKSLQDIDIRQPSLDLSCGDGVFSFLLAGGEFGIDFDIFGSTDNLDKFFDNEDIYNATHSEYDPNVRKRPDYTITVGTDWKQSLLDKADTLDFYEELIEHDNNQPLPFEDNRFKTVFTNSAYWVDNIETHLSEIARVTDSDSGQAILILKTKHVKKFLNDLRLNWQDTVGEELIDMLDRGRSEHYSHVYTDEGWTQRLQDAGFRICERRPTATQFHGQMWDIGLRPISPHLIKMAYSLPREKRCAIKKEWIDTWIRLLEPFHDPQFDVRDREPVEIAYIVEPN